MTWLSSLNPVPSFPSYTGPYTVGTVDVELPVDTRGAPDESISTIAFRLYYPCESDAPIGLPVRWIQNPQRPYVAALAQVLGLGGKSSAIASYGLQALYYVNIPARRNAALLAPPTKSGLWPTTVFSHGLSGNRNAYSHLLGSLASHGVVVFAACHRDGSAPVAQIAPTESMPGKEVPYKQLSHKYSPEIEAARNKQLQIRCWELNALYGAILKLDGGQPLGNLNIQEGSPLALETFKERLDVHRPGSISWTGHSFGAATVVQFVKSIFYRDSFPSDSSSSIRLFNPPADSPLIRQITPNSPIALFDPWLFTLSFSSTKWLWEKPLPCYTRDGPGGSAVLAVLSEAFFKWREHLEKTKIFLSPSPDVDHPSLTTQEKDMMPPRFFYLVQSAHHSQSDFGLMFPWITKKFFNALEPERLLRLNVRTVLQLLRDAGQEVAESQVEEGNGNYKAVDDDVRIFARDGSVRGLIPLTTDTGKSFEEEIDNVGSKY